MRALVIVGGAEHREGDMQVLARFVELCGGAGSSIVVLTAASTQPKVAWEMYDRAFGDLGVQRRAPLILCTRQDAANPSNAEQALQADGIFMTGGDQKRLMAIIGETHVHRAMLAAFKRGACIGGTSAGASAMSAHMLAEGMRDVVPEKQGALLAAGLGLLPWVVIDQHFSERHRLARLLSILAENPCLVGIGIDEDTALVIEGQNRLEVVGTGAITLLDGRQMTSNVLDIDAHERLELINVKLHLLPAGTSYRIPAVGAQPGDDDAPVALREVLRLVTGVGPMSCLEEAIVEDIKPCP
jgi:cyanophycinase